MSGRRGQITKGVLWILSGCVCAGWGIYHAFAWQAGNIAFAGSAGPGTGEEPMAVGTGLTFTVTGLYMICEEARGL